MAESLAALIEEAMQIAWYYLERTGEIEDGVVASRFLSHSIELMIWAGERRRLMLANRAITAYKKFKQQCARPQQASA